MYSSKVQVPRNFNSRFSPRSKISFSAIRKIVACSRLYCSQIIVYCDSKYSIHEPHISSVCVYIRPEHNVDNKPSGSCRNISQATFTPGWESLHASPNILRASHIHQFGSIHSSHITLCPLIPIYLTTRLVSHLLVTSLGEVKKQNHPTVRSRHSSISQWVVNPC